MAIPGGNFSNGDTQFPFISQPQRRDSGMNDPQFDQLVSQALDAAFGATNGQAPPGPISHLMDRLKGDLGRGNQPGLANLLPNGTGQPFTSQLPPLLGGGGQLPGGSPSGGLGGDSFSPNGGLLGGGPGGPAGGGFGMSAPVVPGSQVNQGQNNGNVTINDNDTIIINGDGPGQGQNGLGSPFDQGDQGGPDNPMVQMMFQLFGAMMAMMSSLMQSFLPQQQPGGIR